MTVSSVMVSVKTSPLDSTVRLASPSLIVATPVKPLPMGSLLWAETVPESMTNSRAPKTAEINARLSHWLGVLFLAFAWLNCDIGTLFLWVMFSGSPLFFVGNPLLLTCHLSGFRLMNVDGDQNQVHLLAVRYAGYYFDDVGTFFQGHIQ